MPDKFIQGDFIISDELPNLSKGLKGDMFLHIPTGRIYATKDNDGWPVHTGDRVIPVPNVGVGGPYSGVECPGNGIAQTADAAVAPIWLTYPVITAANLTQSLLTPDLDLRLELLWYKAGRRARRPGSSMKRKNAGFKHPATDQNIEIHGAADTHRGVTHLNISERVTEWPITSRNQVVRINLSSMLRRVSPSYRDINGNATFTEMLAPAWVKSCRGGVSPRPLTGLSGRFCQLYVAFRYSIKDTVKGVGRICGPMSQVLECSHSMSPIIPEISYAVANNGRLAYSHNKQFDILKMKVIFTGQGKGVK